ncbi:MAG: beta-propeller domain-containing protein [Solirubrobacterales bacterium]
MNKDNMNELKKDYNNIEVPAELDLAIEKGIKKGKVYKKRFRAKTYSLVAAVLVLVIGIASSWKTYINKNNELMAQNTISTLPVVGSSENLEKLLKPYIEKNSIPNFGFAQEDKVIRQESASKSMDNSTTGYSTTNLQVQGVDEEDTVKTDGEYIFKVNGGNIINVIKAQPDTNMEAVNNISFEDNYYIQGIYLRNNILVVLGNGNGVTKAISFDVSDKKNIKKVRDVEIAGGYISSRMIDSRVYVIANKNINYGNIKEDGSPYYIDSSIGNSKINIDYSKINYLPDSIAPNYITAACFNVDNNDAASVSTILGSGNNIYSSEKYLYVAGYNWTKQGSSGTASTEIYKFTYENNGIKFTFKGEVPGNIINQFSMDEKDGYFRIATTEYSFNAPATDVSSQKQNSITNSLYILDKEMKVVGKLQGLAKGEQIYSVRFIGDRAYIVTFMLMDPLFVIDLKNPESPKVLGELKIPGFTNYLQPYDETHLIGFGMDTTVVNEAGMDRARAQGMKIALFDVSNVEKPVQQFMTKVGNGSSYSEVLTNHKALLFSKERNLMAIPVSDNAYNSVDNSEQKQGAYIYNIDLVNGIKLKGIISHLDEAGNMSNSRGIYGPYFVTRILYIKDTLYTLSDGLIKANDINNLKEKSKLPLKSGNSSRVYPLYKE